MLHADIEDMQHAIETLDMDDMRDDEIGVTAAVMQRLVAKTTHLSSATTHYLSRKAVNFNVDFNSRTSHRMQKSKTRCFNCGRMATLHAAEAKARAQGRKEVDQVASSSLQVSP